MNLFADIRDATLSAVGALSREGALPDGLTTDAVTVEPPRDPAHGDMATNVAMVLAKPAGARPRDLAEGIAAKLAEDARIARADVAGPGFINLTLTDAARADVARAALADPGYGRSDLGRGTKVMVEFVSANPTGLLHIAHTRGAVFGDALASLLDFAGFDVTREYYVNDGGAQVDAFARSVHLRYLQALGRDVDPAAGRYPGEELAEVGARIAERDGDRWADAPEAEWLPTFRDEGIAAMMDAIRADLARLGVTFDSYFSERELYGSGRIESAIEALRARDLIYRGTLEPPKGKMPEDWEPREQTLFRSTAHGDDVDRPIAKSDGAWTYFAPDIAYHHDKIERGFDVLIDVFGADHGGYVKRMKAAVDALSGGRVPLEVKLIQTVRLSRDGQPFKMSKRAGNVVNLRDVIELVGRDVTRFHMLTRRNDAPLDFDVAKVTEQSKDNPVFYVQYAHARVASVLRKAREAGIDVSDDALRAADLSGLTDPAECAVLRALAEYPRLIEVAARAHEPHRVAFYLYDLASAFHALYNRGNEDAALRMVQDGADDTTRQKCALARAVQVVIASGLRILGSEPLEEMR
ncbi:MAG: arginine--tRNA ligase [Paracoccaceae bacterium]